ncbi:hypothetical protein BGX28_006912 [Mortierella sp. GBA30]|nr:hypothetical protein BGX28_006912 [Mortierella sp. GBA30]
MSGFSHTSKDIQLINGHILKAECETRDGQWVPSELNLDDIIGNNNGNFEWSGENYSKSANDIRLQLSYDESPKLEAQLQTKEGESRGSYILLDHRIENEDGRLIFTAVGSQEMFVTGLFREDRIKIQAAPVFIMTPVLDAIKTHL